MTLRSTGRRRAALAASAAGCTLAIVSGVQLAQAQPPRELPTSFASAAPSSSVAPAPAQPSLPAPPVLAQAPVPVSPPPVQIGIPELGIDAAVTPSADTHTGIEVPDDVSTVGWWVAGGAPQDLTGTTVLVGHVDAYDQGPGALYHLDAARPGTEVALTTADGLVTRYSVTDLQVVRKSAGLPASLFAQDVGPRLVLITCGGPFDERTRDYQDNIVVTAARVD